MSKSVNGVYAALATPRKQNGILDEYSLQKSIEFLLAKGIKGFAINGATGEYCLNTNDELEQILEVSTKVFDKKTNFVVGIGSAGIFDCLEKGKLAIEYGATGVLLPPPHYFPYAQDDLEVFFGEIAQNLQTQILLYNLPQFTSGLDSATSQKLIKNYPNIIGIKDSSGSLETLRDLTKNNIESCRIVGNDSALADALREQVCDGVISGVASAFPELILSIFDLKNETNSAKFQERTTLLDEFIKHINILPTPWGVKIVAESRGIIQASFSQPLSARRKQQMKEILEWFPKWFKQNSDKIL